MAIRLTSYCILINGVWNKISTQTAEIGRKGRDSQWCRPEISTQTAEIGRKGRESHSCRLESSTQTTVMYKKGREFQARGLEISTQMVNNTLSTQFFILQNR